MFKVCFTKESHKSVISIIGIFSGIAARRGTHRNENLHGHVRRFLSGRSSCGPKVFNALIHTYIIRRNESLQGVSEPPPIFTPSCGDPLPSLHDTDEKKSDEHELSQSQRGNVDTDLISLIVENTKMLLRTCDYLKRKSFLETCNCLLNPVSKFSFDKKLGHSEKLSSDDTIETFCSVLRKYNASTLCDFVPERSVFLATSLYLAKNHPQIPLRSPLGEVCGALIDNPRALADHLMDLSLRELRDNVDKYITSTSSNVSDFVSSIVLNAKTSWTRSPLRKELTEALMNVLKCPLVFLSSDDEKEIQLLVPRTITSEFPILLGAADSCCIMSLHLTSHGVVQHYPESKSRRCRCGRKSKSLVCKMSTCTCVSSGFSCDAEPKCQYPALHCENPNGKKTVTNSSKNSCRCGVNASLIFPNTAHPQRCVSKACPCFNKGKSCQHCRCKFCQNPYGERGAVHVGTRSTRQILAKSGDKLSKKSGVDFMSMNNLTPTVGQKWDVNELALLKCTLVHFFPNFLSHHFTIAFNEASAQLGFEVQKSEEQISAMLSHEM